MTGRSYRAGGCHSRHADQAWADRASGRIFRVGSLTTALDVIAHELTHGVTQYSAGLEYRGQSGALNESISDVFGSLVKQRSAGQRADQADWLIGAGILGTALHGAALRSMAAPGTAYEGDPQPATMAGYVDLPDDADRPTTTAASTSTRGSPTMRSTWRPPRSGATRGRRPGRSGTAR